ncbi:hypothetical protein, partial [Gemmiger sp.]|uniref:hypothetical protein n=1 Tax=Gemmiger sp. TaxID=2049027 RepID=UPI00307E88E1
CHRRHRSQIGGGVGRGVIYIPVILFTQTKMSNQQRNQAFKQIHVSTVTTLTRHPRRDARPERHAAVCAGPVQRLAAEAAYEYHISTRHASLTARFVACLFFAYADLRQKYCPARRFSD